MEIKLLPLGAVDAGDRLRAVNAQKVAEMAISFAERGQMMPIEVILPEGAERFRLVSGAHRMAACAAAGLSTVKAIVLDRDTSDDELLLREIDENLYRNELSAYDQATFISKRAEIWERINGTIKRGGRSNPQIAGFTKETAEKFGLSEDAVERARARMKKLRLVWAELRGTQIAEVGSWLDKLRGLDADKQRQVIGLVQRGVPFRNAYAQVRGERVLKMIRPHAECGRLMALWEKTSEEGRELFRKAIRGTKKRGAADEG